MSDEKPMGQVIQIDEARIRDHLGEMVRGTVEETLNAMLDAEADQLCGAGRYERSSARRTRGLAVTRSDAADQRRRSQSQDPEAKATDVRDSNHRTLSPAGELGRGVPDRDVPGRDFGAPSGGHHRR